MKSKLLNLLLSLFVIASAEARDLTEDFLAHTKTPHFSQEEKLHLERTEIVLIPGIVSEAFIWSDRRSPVDFSIATEDYFGTQLKFLRDSGFKVHRLKASSYSVKDTYTELEKLFQSTDRPLLFMGHSLGGMTLLDFLLVRKDLWHRVDGIVFLQSPFTGAPMASVVQKFPALSFLFPLVYVSKDTVKYLSLENRKDFVRTNEAILQELSSSIPVLTAGGVVNGYRSMFSATTSVIRSGCLRPIRGKCRGAKLFEGPFDDSDGMVPFEGSKLPGANFVKLPGVDHGETVVNIPFQNFPKKHLTVALLKVLLQYRE